MGYVLSSTIKYYNQQQSFADKLFLLFYSQLFLQLLLLLDLLFLQLLLEVRVTQHVILAIFVDLEIRIIGHFEAIVDNGLLDFYLFGHLLVDQLFHFLFPSLENVGLLELVFQFVVQFQVHQISVHVLLEHFGIDEVFAAELAHLLLAHEFVLIVNHFAVLFFQLFGDVVDVGHPLGAWPQLRNEITADFRLFQRCEQESARVDNCEHVYSVVWFYAGEELALAIGNFDLFFVAEEDVFGAVVHEVNRVDGFVVG